MRVVLAGSRKLSFLPSEIKLELMNLIRLNSVFLVGDAPGVDVSFQRFLHENEARNVIVFSSAGYVRNNVGNWSFEQIETPLKAKSSDLHAYKDRKMCSSADFGLMVWDTESAGTLSNVLDLVGQGKECGLFNVFDGEFINFGDFNSLKTWCERYPEVTEEAARRLSRYSKRTSRLETDENPEATLF
jgi:hypothetical protein